MRYVAFIILALSLSTGSIAQEDNGLGRIQQRADLSRTLPNGWINAPAGVEPDTTSPWRYYPLHIGNVWEYEWENGFMRHGIDRDTVIDNVNYVIFQLQFFNSSGGSADVFESPLRYDTMSATVLVRSPDGVEGPHRYAKCRLDYDFGETAKCLNAVVRGGPDSLYVFGSEPPADTLFNATFKIFDYGLGVYEFVAGIGNVFEYNDKSSYVHRLRYAIIDDVVYGAPVIPVGTEGVAPRDSHLTILRVSPNPFRTRTHVEFEVSQTGPIRIDIFNMLGQRVRHIDLGVLASGSHVLELEGRGLAAGQYGVHIQSNRHGATVMVVRLL